MSRLQHDGVSKTGILSCTAHVLRAAVTLSMIHQASQGDSDNNSCFRPAWVPSRCSPWESSHLSGMRDCEMTRSAREPAQIPRFCGFLFLCAVVLVGKA